MFVTNNNQLYYSCEIKKGQCYKKFLKYTHFTCVRFTIAFLHGF